MRDVAMAARDPALYYIQFALVLLFGFLVGAAFLRTKYNIDKSLANVSGGLLWLVFMMAYIQIFKVRYASCPESVTASHLDKLSFICFSLVSPACYYTITYFDTYSSWLSF